MEQIKVGDIVRVSEDAPSLYTDGWFYKWMENDSSVLGINGEDALIGAPDDCNSELAIPTKYLIKVNAEPKEAKFKKGDKVRFKKIYTVASVDDGQVFIDSAGNHFDEDCLEPYTEPTEQTEAEKADTDNIVDDFAKAMEGCRKVFADIADDFDWQRYEADLAKEIAVKIASPLSLSPEDAANYAVRVAKSVVENLKKSNPCE